MTQVTVDVDALVIMSPGEDLNVVTTSGRSNFFNETEDICIHDGTEVDDENYPSNIQKFGIFHKTIKNAGYAILYREISHRKISRCIPPKSKYILGIYIWPETDFDAVKSIIEELGLEM